MESYTQLKERQQDEFNNFDIGAAFSNEQFKEMMKKWGFREKQIGNIISIGNGCYIKKSDKDAYIEMIKRHKKEHEDAIAADKTGEGYIYQMFLREMCNHEYGYTYELDDTLMALGLKMSTIMENEALSAGLKKAMSKFN